MQNGIIRLHFISKPLEKLDWKESKSAQQHYARWLNKMFWNKWTFIRKEALLPATPLVPCDRLWGRARRSTRGCERQRSGRWRWWRPAWRTAAWCKPQTQWRGKTTPAEREREREVDLWKKLQGRQTERQNPQIDASGLGTRDITAQLRVQSKIFHPQTSNKCGKIKHSWMLPSEKNMHYNALIVSDSNLIAYRAFPYLVVLFPDTRRHT